MPPLTVQVRPGRRLLPFSVFLQDSAKGGRAAADGVMRSFKWIQRHLGFHALPHDSPLLRPAPSHPPSVLKQAPELPLKIWTHLITIACSGSDNLSLIASLVLYTGVHCLRFKHAQRHSFMHEQCTHRTLMGKVVRGKRRGRRAFYIAGPACAAPGNDVFGRMYGQLANVIPDADFLVPDFRTPGRGGRLHGQIDLMKHAVCSGVCAPSLSSQPSSRGGAPVHDLFPSS